MKILYLVPHVPNPTKARSWYHIRGLLEAGHQVMVATLERSADDQTRLTRLQERGSGIISAGLSRPQMALNAARALLGGRPLQADLMWSDDLMTSVAEYTRRQRPDIIHVEHLRMAAYGLRLREFRPVIWDAVDYLTPLFAQAARSGQGLPLRQASGIEAQRLPAYERWLTGQFPRTLVITSRDQALLGKDNAHADRIRVASFGLPMQQVADQPRDPATLIMTGTLNYHPNVASALYFARAIWPELRGRYPALQCQLVGADPTPAVQALTAEGITITGFVPSVMDYLARATVALAPVQYGAGIQIKVLEAFLSGTPVVASSVALRGLEVKDGEHLLVADTPADFAAAVGRLLDDADLRARLGAAGRQYVEAHHDLQATTHKLVKLYTGIINHD
jgi:polysaccharide biosynthesis protein PslH